MNFAEYQASLEEQKLRNRKIEAANVAAEVVGDSLIRGVKDPEAQKRLKEAFDSDSGKLFLKMMLGAVCGSLAEQAPNGSKMSQMAEMFNSAAIEDLIKLT